MSVRNGCCCINSDSCLVGNTRRSRSGRYYGIIRPLAFFMITTLLAMTVSHICDKFSANGSLMMIKTDLINLKKHLSILTLEVKDMLKMRAEMENKLIEVGLILPKISEDIHKLRNDVSDDIGVHSKNVESVRNVVKSELRLYDADKTGRTDYALEALGGSIISIRDTENYEEETSKITLFGVSLCKARNSPSSVIKADVMAGHCWSFKGSKGRIVIKLIGSVYVSSVSLEHISAEMAPSGETSSAPRDFSVWGLRHPDDSNGFLLGEFTYDNSGPPLQNFPVSNPSAESYEIIEVIFHSNSGNPDYTCVYRIRVHGTLNNR